MATGVCTVVKHATTDPRIAGFNPDICPTTNTQGNGREIEVLRLSLIAATHWKSTLPMS